MTTPSAQVRLAGREDAGVLAQLNQFVHGLHGAARPDVFRPAPAVEELTPIFSGFLAREGAIAFIAELGDGTPVGYITATIHDRPADALMHARSFVFVEHIAVNPQVARTRVGSVLVEAVRVAGLEAGCTSLITDVWDFNTQALAFFGEGQRLRPMRHWLEAKL
ncbi:GNAT family N-acetyltransferase [Nonomuraea sp. NPDC048882]|uniref:GNAT family N-acetyltransferase n=1 Tax=Nonomuraea sp. NPDC048882 TaxID=3154347 RepID=UPI0033F89B7C